MSSHPEVRPVYYNKGCIEAWDFIADWNLDFFEGNILKYIIRWKEKHGLDDLRKALTYLHKRSEMNTPKQSVPGRISMQVFCESNNLVDALKEVLWLTIVTGKYKSACALLQTFIQDVERELSFERR